MAFKKLIQHEYDKFLGDSSVRVVNSSGDSITPSINLYQVNDMDDGNTTASILYIGMEKDDGTWLVKKLNETTGTLPVFTYATVVNNTATTTYDSAWTNRATLTYNRYASAF